MAEPILVADLGTCTTAAALVTGDQVRVIREPVTGAQLWSSAVWHDGAEYLVSEAAERRGRAVPAGFLDAPRRALDQRGLRPGEPDGGAPLAAYLAALTEAAERLCPGGIDRLVLAVPAGYGVPDPRRDVLITAAEQAGFVDVELINDAAAAVLDAGAVHSYPEQALVLVCDLGATFTTALIEVRSDATVQLAQETSAGGRELDRLLLDALRAEAGTWLDPLLAAPGDAGRWARWEVAEFLGHLKHQLADTPETTDPAATRVAVGRLGPSAPPFELTRNRLRMLADPALRWVVASCRSLLARAGRDLAEVAAVVLVGGASRLPGVVPAVQSGLRRPVYWAPEPDLAVVRGAARWATRVQRRKVPAGRARWRIEPLAWQLPVGQARLERWLVAEGEAYSAGALLARVRTADERVLDLTAAGPGTLLSHRAHPGDLVGPAQILAGTRTAASITEDPPAKMHELSVNGDWLLTPDRRLLVECEETGRCVRLRAIGSGAVLREFRPDVPTDRGRVFIRPGGALSLLAWGQDGDFSLWDVDSGALLARIPEAGSPLHVLVNESAWRLAIEGESRVSAGRYRRNVTTVWDLNTGRRLEKTIDAGSSSSWTRRNSGYSDRSAADGFATAARSPDGRLRAGAQRDSGRTLLALHEEATDRQVFRVEHRADEDLRTAFSADGRYLLANWERTDRSQVDVYEL